MTARWRILHGDCREQLCALPERSVQTCVTSPPYWGLRDYGVDGQLGLERTPDEYIESMVGVFDEVRRVLRDDGTLWLNIGDCYASSGGVVGVGGGRGGNEARIGRAHQQRNHRIGVPDELKPKDLVGIPWMLAFALRANGWTLRMDVIWHKPNPTPESVEDRPTKAHEYLFLMSKSADYFYDRHAIMEPVTSGAHHRGRTGVHQKTASPGKGIRANSSFEAAVRGLVGERNRRSVWTVQSAPFPEAHFATFPPDLVAPCILAGTSEAGACPTCGAAWTRVLGDPIEAEGGRSGNAERQVSVSRVDGRLSTHLGYNVPYAPTVTPTIGWRRECNCAYAPPVSNVVLDPFAGSGTTGMVALRLGRAFVGCELNAEYVAMAERRIVGDSPLFNRAG